MLHYTEIPNFGRSKSLSLDKFACYPSTTLFGHVYLVRNKQKGRVMKMKATGTSWHAFSLFSLHLFWFWTAVLRSQPPPGPPEAVKAHMKAFTPAVRPRQKSWAKSSPEKVTFWRWSFSHSRADVCVGMCVCDGILGVRQPEALGGRWGIWTSLLARAVSHGCFQLHK